MINRIKRALQITLFRNGIFPFICFVKPEALPGQVSQLEQIKFFVSPLALKGVDYRGDIKSFIGHYIHNIQIAVDKRRLFYGLAENVIKIFPRRLHNIKRAVLQPFFSVKLCGGL